MTTRDNFGDINEPAPGPSAPIAPGRTQGYQFTNDELRVLRECNRDSFFQRCLPIGTVLGVATYYGVQNGQLKGSPRWGATPKVVAATIIGYFIGKISYQTKCAERLMNLPDSKLGAILRERKRGSGFQESLDPGYGPGMALSPFSNINPSDTYSDVDPKSAPPKGGGRGATPDLDTTRPDNSGLDDNMRPSVDNSPVFEEDSMPPIQDKTTTYDELRKQNREGYQKQRTNFRTTTNAPEAPQGEWPQPESIEKTPYSRPQSTPRQTNIYGDSME